MSSLRIWGLYEGRKLLDDLAVELIGAGTVARISADQQASMGLRTNIGGRNAHVADHLAIAHLDEIKDCSFPLSGPMLIHKAAV